MPSADAGSVKVTDSVYQVCVAHALMTEREEVMGLLVGDVVGRDVLIWGSMTLRRSDKRPDRCEISPEQLVEAAEGAEKFSEELGRRSRVVGWYHSHPHITVLPSHVDLRTQMQYQGMDPSFVGLIFAVFDADTRAGTLRHQLMAFRAAPSGAGGASLSRLELQVVVVPLCELLTEEEERQAASSEAFGGLLGQRAMVATASQCFKEVRDVHREHLESTEQQHGAGSSGRLLDRLGCTARYISHLQAFARHELVPLKQHFESEATNAHVLADVHRRAAKWLQSDVLRTICDSDENSSLEEERESMDDFEESEEDEVEPIYDDLGSDREMLVDLPDPSQSEELASDENGLTTVPHQEMLVRTAPQTTPAKVAELGPVHAASAEADRIDRRLSREESDPPVERDQAPHAKRPKAAALSSSPESEEDEVEPIYDDLGSDREMLVDLPDPSQSEDLASDENGLTTAPHQEMLVRTAPQTTPAKVAELGPVHAASAEADRIDRRLSREESDPPAERDQAPHAKRPKAAALSSSPASSPPLRPEVECLPVPPSSLAQAALLPFHASAPAARRSVAISGLLSSAQSPRPESPPAPSRMFLQPAPQAARNDALSQGASPRTVRAPAQKTEQPAVKRTQCMAKVRCRQKHGSFLQCKRAPAEDCGDLCRSHFKTLPNGRVHAAKPTLASIARAGAARRVDMEFSGSAASNDVHDFEHNTPSGRVTYDATAGVYTATRNGTGGDRGATKSFSQREWGDEAQFQAQMYLICNDSSAAESR